MKSTRQQLDALIAAGATLGPTVKLPEPPLPKCYPPLYLMLPFPPTVNTYWRHVGSKVLLSSAGRKYRKAVAFQCECQGAWSFGTHRLNVSIDVHLPDNRKRDLDNLPKGILDSLAHAGVYVDDSQIDCLIVRRCFVESPGRVAVIVSPRLTDR